MTGEKVNSSISWNHGNKNSQEILWTSILTIWRDFSFYGSHSPHEAINGLAWKQWCLVAWVFLTSLIGSCFKWFHKLKLRCIRSFFKQTFVTYYLSNRKEKKGVDNLFQLKTFPGELLRSSVERLCDHTFQVIKCDLQLWFLLFSEDWQKKMDS